MNIAAFAALFQSYASSYRYKATPESEPKPLGFFHFDMEDVLSGLQTIALPALFLSTPEVDFGGTNADNITNNNEASFMVMLQLPGKDIKKKAQTIQAAKEICEQIIRRMQYDCAQGILALDGFQINGLKCGIVNRTVDNLFGWTVSFNTEEAFDGEIQPNLWEDLTP